MKRSPFVPLNLKYVSKYALSDSFRYHTNKYGVRLSSPLISKDQLGMRQISHRNYKYYYNFRRSSSPQDKFVDYLHEEFMKCLSYWKHQVTIIRFDGEYVTSDFENEE